MLGYDWQLCMVINIRVQYNGGLLPDIIQLTQGYYHWGTRLNTMCSGFVFIAYVIQYITTTMCDDGVLHCLWCAVNVFLASLYGD